MSRGAKAGILILAVIVIMVLGFVIPNQFNDKSVVNNTKDNVKKENEAQKKKTQKATTPDNLSDDTFKNKYNEQSTIGRNFVETYYKYSFKAPDENFNKALDYIDKDYKEEKDLSNDETGLLVSRQAKVKNIKPVQADSDNEEVAFKYSVELTEERSTKSFDESKAKKDSKYLKKLDKSETKTTKDITVRFRLKDNKIIGLNSNYL
ncbi:hypothetical protein [Staphylococcus gallinarum]|uniref:hypothetical protein n=1 Tax=Staphylococcus gallinarum TaxID=1293 RepID=UPI0030C37406